MIEDQRAIKSMRCLCALTRLMSLSLVLIGAKLCRVLGALRMGLHRAVA